MSGICGFAAGQEKPFPERQRVLEAMSGSIAHRGGGMNKYFFDARVSLCFLAAKGDGRDDTGGELFTDERGRYRLLGDGTIYNHSQLRRELQGRGHRFKTRKDLEVIIHLFEEMGPACPCKLRGPFAFALWDSQAESLYLARDRFGIKPLYYSVASDKALVFASEAKALLKYPHIKGEVNLAALPHYLTFQYFPDPETAFNGIYRLRPAHHLTWDGQEIKTKKYWEIRFRPDTTKPSNYFIDKAAYLIKESVRLHCGEGTMPGAFLSSGIDSGNIAALLSMLGEVKTFSVDCAGSKYDELTPARNAARFLGTEHHEGKIGAAEFWNKVPQALWHQDEPVADPAAIALFFAASLAAKEVKAVLSGEGADEVFGGYEIYREPRALTPIQGLPSRARAALARASEKILEGRRGINYIRRATTPLEKRYYGNALIFSEPDKKMLLNTELYHAGWVPPWEITAPYYRKSAGTDGATRMQHLDFYTWLPGDILAKADRMSSAHSLDLRLPYLDHHLVEFAVTIPTRYRITRRMTKYVLRMSTSSYLPREIYSRPKLGFPVPLASWIRKYYREQLQELWRSNTAQTYFNPHALEKMLEAHCQGKADYGRKIWTVAVFLLWHNLYFK